MALQHNLTIKPAGRSRAKAHASLSLVNGRLVGPELTDPAVKKKLAAAKKVLRNTKGGLLKSYVKMGMLTANGKLTKSFGG